MRERILDDWYYQSNARRIITEELEKAKLTNHKYNLDDMAGEVQKKSRKIMRQLAVNYDITAGTSFEVAFPWNRLFEVDITQLKQDKNKLRNRSRAARGLLPDVFPIRSD